MQINHLVQLLMMLLKQVIIELSIYLLFAFFVFRFNQHFRQNIPKYIRKSLPPSIPDPKSSYGFEEDDNGNLVAHQPPSEDPDFSNPTVTVCNFVFIY